ncbi:MAG: tetratricopeptide repeat protein [Candidatus Obscuribacterales bacterium]|nr:tetratricopeptide repeat protein [Candidatus Obscuribacterales bacterium]
MSEIFKSKSLRLLVEVLLTSILLSSCTLFDRPNYLRFWEFNRLAAEKERLAHHYVQAEKNAKEAVYCAERLGFDDFRLAVSLNDLSRIYLERKKYSYAEALLQRSLKVLEAASGKNMDVLQKNIIAQEKAEALIDLAELRYKKSDLKNALCYFNEAEKILEPICSYRSAESSGSPLAENYVRACWGLAETYAALKKNDQAMADFQRALQIAEAEALPLAPALEERFLAYLTGQNDRAAISKIEAEKEWLKLSLSAHALYQAGDYEAAKQEYTRALELTNKFPDYDLRRAVTYKALAQMCRRLADHAGWHAYDLQALNICLHMKPVIFSLKDNLLTSIVEGLEADGKYSQLEPFLLEQLQARIERYGENSTIVAETQSHLAASELALNKRQAARSLAYTALATLIKAKTYKRYTCDSLSTLAQIFWQLQEYDRAEEALRQAIKISRDILKLDDGRAPTQIFSLADILAMQSKTSESNELLAGAFKSLESLKAKRYIEVAYALETLAAQRASNAGCRERFIRWQSKLAAAFKLLKDKSDEQEKSMQEISARLSRKN